MVLKTSGDLGEVTISNNVISEIAGAVATKCYGVVGMASRNKKDGIVNLLKPDSMTKGISITVEEGGVIQREIAGGNGGAPLIGALVWLQLAHDNLK